ncbi:MAG: class B sortase [Lachnospiraceae bacterium]|uniref:Class B sortase n=1 Tax=Porcincola intestinalis TaxID=2606632 RepID=A0A6L5X0F1_9FIRM|nr:class B sortase [Porcincola intestinalis]MCI6767105.1 class B sortase [Lachnospiraceae bacterium]MSS13821.1 class B sortase [Porcincola intestinalis]
MRRWFTGVLFLFSIVLLTISIYFLMGMFQDYRAESDLHDRLKEIHETADIPGDDVDKTSSSESEGSEKRELEVVIDEGLLALHDDNPDCIYWITIPDTPIDYPVMYHPQEKDYYLHRDFYGDYLASGTLYLEEDCDPDIGDNLIIYGHHMNSGSMFAALDMYKSRDFYEEHPMVVLQTLHGEENYRIMAAFATPVYTRHDFDYYGFTVTGDPTKYESYVKACLSRSFYDTGVTAVYGQRLLTLSTCEYTQKNGRMVVVAVQEDASGGIGKGQ